MKYILTEEQLLVLVSLCGLERFPCLGRPELPGDADLIRTVAGLYRLGCLEESADRMVPAPAFRQMLDALGQAETVLNLWFAVPDAGLHLVCGSGRDRVVILEKDLRTGAPVYRLWQDQPARYLHDLFEGGLLPRRLTRDRADARALEELAWQENPPDAADLRPLARVERVSAETGSPVSRVEVAQGTIFTWIYRRSDEEEFYHLYSEEELAELLLQEMRGNRT